MKLRRPLSIFVCWILTSSALAAEDELISHSSLLPYAVGIHRTPMQSWGPGAGIYLGNGLVLTAAHVVGRAFLTRPKVIIAGQEIEASTVKEGSFEGVDLTLLYVDEVRLPVSLRLRRLALCQKAPWPGESVVTVIPGNIVRSVIISPLTLPLGARKFDTVIRDVAKTGNSGSGVFDYDKKCLLGIMSRKISDYRPIENRLQTRELRDVAKYFVPAAKIAEFIPPQYKF